MSLNIHKPNSCGSYKPEICWASTWRDLAQIVRSLKLGRLDSAVEAAGAREHWRFALDSVCVCMYLYIYTHIHIHTYIHIYICIFIHDMEVSSNGDTPKSSTYR